MKSQFEETLYDAYGQNFSIEKIYYDEKSKHQHITIFHNAKFGRVMALDGIIQTTERDEFIYHEMLTHVPIFSHGTVNTALIIGGGDGGILREVLKHKSVTTVTMVEIDSVVIEMCIKYLPEHSQGSFNDPRLNLVIDDGAKFVARTKEKFDIIIVDSTDPIGPGEILFYPDFHKNCKEILNKNGIIVTQNGVPFMQPEEIQNTAKCFSQLYDNWSFYLATVPTYVGGDMAFGIGTDKTSPQHTSIKKLQKRCDTSGFNTRYYNANVHLASFSLPKYVLDIIAV